MVTSARPRQPGQGESGLSLGVGKGGAGPPRWCIRICYYGEGARKAFDMGEGGHSLWLRTSR